MVAALATDRLIPSFIYCSYSSRDYTKEYNFFESLLLVTCFYFAGLEIVCYTCYTDDGTTIREICACVANCRCVLISMCNGATL